MEQDESALGRRVSKFHWLLLAGCVALYLILRAPWVGHLMNWDEAMNLCAVRSFASQARDFYSSYIWHHPPLFSLLLLLVQPLEPGFAERAQMLLIGIGTLNLLVLFLLVRRTMGVPAALWSAFFYAVMPSTIFYDLWLKQDPLAALFGLVAIYFFIDRRVLFSGLCLGLGLLSKETATFYAFAIALLWLFRKREERQWRDILAVVLVPLATCGWWYFGFSTSIQYFIAFALDLKNMKTDVWVWARPWYYYFAKLPLDLGWFGIILVLAGCAGFVFVKRDRQALWPLFVLVPAYFILSTAKGKSIWFTTALFPVVAVLQGAGMTALTAALEELLKPFSGGTADGKAWGRIVQAAVIVLVAARMAKAVWGRDYEQVLQQQDKPLWWGASASREAALELNKYVEQGQRALITPMYFWEGRDIHPCPIFVYHLEPMPVIVRPYDIAFSNFVEAVKTYKLDWAMVSTWPDQGPKNLLLPLAKEYGILAIPLQGGWIIPTSAICER